MYYRLSHHLEFGGTVKADNCDEFLAHYNREIEMSKNAHISYNYHCVKDMESFRIIREFDHYINYLVNYAKTALYILHILHN